MLKCNCCSKSHLMMLLLQVRSYLKVIATVAVCNHLWVTSLNLRESGPHTCSLIPLIPHFSLTFDRWKIHTLSQHRFVSWSAIVCYEIVLVLSLSRSLGQVSLDIEKVFEFRNMSELWVLVFSLVNLVLLVLSQLRQKPILFSTCCSIHSRILSKKKRGGHALFRHWLTCVSYKIPELVLATLFNSCKLRLLI